MAFRNLEKVLSPMLSMDEMSELPQQAAQKGIKSLRVWAPGVDIS